MLPRVLLVSFGIVFGLAAAEAMTRIFIPDPAFVFENRIELFQEDRFVGYKNAPGYSGYAQGTLSVRTNALGYRGPEVATEKPPGTFRIIGLGDSVMFGVSVQERDGFLRILEQRLNESAARPRPPFEVINTGVIGYSTHQEMLTLEHYGIALAPDLVIVGFVMNDAYPTEDPFFNLQHFHRPAKQTVNRREYVEIPPVRFYFLRFLRARARMLRERLRADELDGPTEADEWKPGTFEWLAWPVLQEHFRTMKRLAMENDFRLLVLIFPSSGQLEFIPPMRRPQSRMAAFFEAEQIEHLDFSTDFEGRKDELLLDWTHFSVAGHNLVAHRIQRYIERVLVVQGEGE